jgi:hypothetical protein
VRRAHELSEPRPACPAVLDEAIDRHAANVPCAARDPRRRGVHTIDVPAERLTVATIQRYLELKSRFL